MAMLNNQRVTTGWWCNNHLEKYEFVNGVGIIPYIMGRISLDLPSGKQTFAIENCHLWWIYP